MINRPTIIIRLGRFLSVGVVNTGIHYGIFLLLFRLFDIYYLTASTIGYCCGLVNSFLLNKLWTFKTASNWNRIEAIRFVVVNLASLLVNLGSLKFFIFYGSVFPEVAQIMAIMFSLVVNFLGNNYWTFRMAPESARTSSELPQKF